MTTVVTPYVVGGTVGALAKSKTATAWATWATSTGIELLAGDQYDKIGVPPLVPGSSIIEGIDIFNPTPLNVGEPSHLNDSLSNPAGGGFVLYPNKPNTNMMQSVYSKK